MEANIRLESKSCKWSPGGKWTFDMHQSAVFERVYHDTVMSREMIFSWRWDPLSFSWKMEITFTYSLAEPRCKIDRTMSWALFYCCLCITSHDNKSHSSSRDETTTRGSYKLINIVVLKLISMKAKRKEAISSVRSWRLAAAARKKNFWMIFNFSL